MRNIIVTGAGGYIGTEFVELALMKGYKITGLDNYLFGQDLIADFANNPNFTTLKKDIRDITIEDLEPFDAVVDLAAISNDPAGDLDPKLTWLVNALGRIMIAEKAKDAGVSRYVMASTASVYGASTIPEVTEDGPLNPLTIYAKSSLAAERFLISIADDKFCASAVRNATVFGKSRRMRFDLVVNIMTKYAYEQGKIVITGGGQQWRPLVSVRDVARGLMRVLEAPTDTVNRQVYNIGHKNHTMAELGERICAALPPGIDLRYEPGTNDQRSYSMSFAKARDEIGFVAKETIEDAAREIYSAFEKGEIDSSERTITLRWYQRAIADQQSSEFRVAL